MPAVSDASGVTCSYNGITFGVATSSDVQSVPNYSADGRTVVSVTHTITIKSKVFAASVTTGNDSTLESVRRALTKPSKALYYNGKGYGNNLTINTGTSGALQDLRWGPKPKVLSWKPLGGNLAAEIVFQVEVCIWECSRSVSPLNLVEVNTKYSWRIDEAGYTTQTYSGFAQIPGWRSAGGRGQTLAATADQVRETLIPAPPLGFRREQNYTLSDDKSRLDWEVVDTELDGLALPPGVVHARVSHTVQTAPGTLLQWVGTIQGDYELVRTMPRNKGWEYFMKLVVDSRVKYSLYGSGQGNKGPTGSGGPSTGARLKNDIRGPVVPLGFSLSEPDVYGRNRSRFTFTYTLASSPGPILSASGLFLPVPGERDLLGWRNSMVNAHHPRGHAKLKFEPRHDAIISLCDTPATAQAVTTTTGLQRGSDAFPFSIPCPPPEKSFLAYDLRVKIIYQHGTVELRNLPEKPVKLKAGPAEIDLNKGVPGHEDGRAKLVVNQGGYGSLYSSPEKESSILQQRTMPGVIIQLSGHAVRVCYPITPPSLDSVAGVEATPYFVEGDHFKTWISGNLLLPMTSAHWRLSWILPEVPTGYLGVPPNPLLGK